MPLIIRTNLVYREIIERIIERYGISSMKEVCLLSLTLTLALTLTLTLTLAVVPILTLTDPALTKPHSKPQLPQLIPPYPILPYPILFLQVFAHFDSDASYLTLSTLSHPILPYPKFSHPTVPYLTLPRPIPPGVRSL